MLLAFDISSAGFTLGIERVEVLFEAFFGGFAGIDGTTILIHDYTPPAMRHP